MAGAIMQRAEERRSFVSSNTAFVRESTAAKFPHRIPSSIRTGSHHPVAPCAAPAYKAHTSAPKASASLNKFNPTMRAK